MVDLNLRSWVGKERVTLKDSGLDGASRTGRVVFDLLETSGDNPRLGHGLERRYYFKDSDVDRYTRIYASGPNRVIALTHNTLYILPRNSLPK